MVMETKLNETNKMKACNPYPRGRWTSSHRDDRDLRRVSVPAVLTDVRLRTLFWNLPESDLAREASQRIDLLLETVTMVPPFLTGMDCPMPEAA